MNDSRVEIDVGEVRRKDSAILVVDADGRKAWLPLSQVEFLEHEYQGSQLLLKLLIPEWLAIEKGLV